MTGNETVEKEGGAGLKKKESFFFDNYFTDVNFQPKFTLQQELNYNQ